MRCVLFRNLLTAVVLAGDEPGWPLRSHIGHCIRCQAHVASLRSTRRRLAELGNARIEAPAGLELRVMDNLEKPIDPQVPDSRWLRAAGASMAAALVAGLWMRRRALARV
ncbi:MAG TPA: hypothetical protein VJQ79_05680 [Acidimicrobiia bacterium]|nr:hypothetical protein [Acidimicrobiia bacterium]